MQSRTAFLEEGRKEEEEEEEEDKEVQQREMTGKRWQKETSSPGLRPPCWVQFNFLIAVSATVENLCVCVLIFNETD